MSKHPQQEIERLRDEIRYHDRKYYVEAQPEISDRNTTACCNGSRTWKPNIRS